MAGQIDSAVVVSNRALHCSCLIVRTLIRIQNSVLGALRAPLFLASISFALTGCGGIYNGETYPGEWIDGYGHLNSFFVIPANMPFIPALTFPYGNRIIAGHSYIGHFYPPDHPGDRRFYNSGGLLVAIIPEESGKAFRLAGTNYPVYPDDTRRIPTYTLVLQRDLHHFFGSHGSRDILTITTFIPHVAPTETMAKKRYCPDHEFDSR